MSATGRALGLLIIAFDLLQLVQYVVRYASNRTYFVGQAASFEPLMFFFVHEISRWPNGLAIERVGHRATAPPAGAGAYRGVSDNVCEAPVLSGNSSASGCELNDLLPGSGRHDFPVSLGLLRPNQLTVMLKHQVAIR